MPKRKIGSVDASLGRNLIYYRKLTGLTQQQLAEALNINRTTYTKYETGDSEPSVEMLRHISALLHVRIIVSKKASTCIKPFLKTAGFDTLFRRLDPDP